MPDELPTKICIPKFYFPVNEALLPDLPGILLLLAVFLFIKTVSKLVSETVSKSSFSAPFSLHFPDAGSDVFSGTTFRRLSNGTSPMLVLMPFQVPETNIWFKNHYVSSPGTYGLQRRKLHAGADCGRFPVKPKNSLSGKMHTENQCCRT
ncbi:MAG: hypothetical protein WC384_22195 [Prolixibacteraceae bacterium]